MQDENFQEKHLGPGLLSMVCTFGYLRCIFSLLLYLRRTRGRIRMAARYAAPLSRAHTSADMGASQFFVTTAKCDFLDGKHVVFGKVIDGMLTLRKIENVPTGPNNRPKLAVKVVGK